MDILDQLEEYERVRGDNQAKQQHWATELDKLRKAHTGTQTQQSRTGIFDLHDITGRARVRGRCLRTGSFFLMAPDVCGLGFVQRTWNRTLTSTTTAMTRTRRRRRTPKVSHHTFPSARLPPLHSKLPSLGVSLGVWPHEGLIYLPLVFRRSRGGGHSHGAGRRGGRQATAGRPSTIKAFVIHWVMGVEDKLTDPCEYVLQEDGKKMSKKRRRLQLRVFDEAELLALDKEDVKYRINLLEQVAGRTYGLVARFADDTTISSISIKQLLCFRGAENRMWFAAMIVTGAGHPAGQREHERHGRVPRQGQRVQGAAQGPRQGHRHQVRQASSQPYIVRPIAASRRFTNFRTF